MNPDYIVNACQKRLSTCLKVLTWYSLTRLSFYIHSLIYFHQSKLKSFWKCIFFWNVNRMMIAWPILLSQIQVSTNVYITYSKCFVRKPWVRSTHQTLPCCLFYINRHWCNCEMLDICHWLFCFWLCNLFWSTHLKQGTRWLVACLKQYNSQLLARTTINVLIWTGRKYCKLPWLYPRLLSLRVMNDDVVDMKVS